MNTDNANIQLIDQALASVPGPCRIHVGFSGGLDSTVLLHMLVAWRQAQTAQQQQNLNPTSALCAIHINHQLLPEAENWQSHCQQVCDQWRVPLTACKVSVNQAQSSLEQEARLARYQSFDEQVEEGEVLMLAHHRDDQVETLLQRLARGSGPLGLSAMSMVSPREGYRIIRPLLELDREQLEQYATTHNLSWIEDPSNRNDEFERNFLRNQLLPLWRGNRAQLNQTLARSARLCGESAALLDQLAQLDLGQPRQDDGLPMVSLEPLGLARRNNLLRFWLRQQGIQPPSEVLLGRIESEVMGAAPDAQPKVEWGRCSVRRFQSVLYCVDIDLPEAADVSIPLSIPFGSIRLPYGSLEPVSQSCFSRAALQQGSLSIGFRTGGERLVIPGRPSKPLKDVFQEKGVPPWLRNVWPILQCDGHIAGLPGLLVCAGFEPQSVEDELPMGWVRG